MLCIFGFYRILISRLNCLNNVCAYFCIYLLDDDDDNNDHDDDDDDEDDDVYDRAVSHLFNFLRLSREPDPPNTYKSIWFVSPMIRNNDLYGL